MAKCKLLPYLSQFTDTGKAICIQSSFLTENIAAFGFGIVYFLLFRKHFLSCCLRIKKFMMHELSLSQLLILHYVSSLDENIFAPCTMILFWDLFWKMFPIACLFLSCESSMPMSLMKTDPVLKESHSEATNFDLDFFFFFSNAWIRCPLVAWAQEIIQNYKVLSTNMILLWHSRMLQRCIMENQAQLILPFEKIANWKLVLSVKLLIG